MMKSLFHPVCKYIFVRANRRSRQIIMLVLKIVYSLFLLIIDMTRTRLYYRQQLHFHYYKRTPYKSKHHTYLNVLLIHNDKYNYNFYIYSFFSSIPQKNLSVSSVFHLPVSSTFHSEVCTFQSGTSSLTVKEGIFHIIRLLG